MPNIYAIYKGDTFLAEGTVKELAEELGIKESTVRFYTSPTKHKRSGKNGMVAVLVEEDVPEPIPELYYKAAAKRGISRKNVNQRYRELGWPLLKAISDPVGPARRVSRREQEKEVHLL